MTARNPKPLAQDIYEGITNAEDGNVIKPMAAQFEGDPLGLAGEMIKWAVDTVTGNVIGGDPDLLDVPFPSVGDMTGYAKAVLEEWKENQ